VVYRLVNEARDNVIEDVALGSLERILGEFSYGLADVRPVSAPDPKAEHRGDEIP
jgi:hypothetical protein